MILVRDGLNVIAKLGRGLEHAEHDWVVCIHADVWLPLGWDVELAQQIQEAERRFGPIGVAGVYGVGDVIASDDPTLAIWRRNASARSSIAAECSRMGQSCRHGWRRSTNYCWSSVAIHGSNSTRCSGIISYGGDLCLQARELGMATVALGALCHHNSRHVGLGEGFHESAAVFARKWKHRLPVATSCVIIDRDGEVQLLGNAVPGPGRSRMRAETRGAGKASVHGKVGSTKITVTGRAPRGIVVPCVSSP